MTIDQRLKALARSLELIAAMQKETKKIHKQNQKLVAKMRSANERLPKIDDRGRRLGRLEAR